MSSNFAMLMYCLSLQVRNNARERSSLHSFGPFFRALPLSTRSSLGPRNSPWCPQPVKQHPKFVYVGERRTVDADALEDGLQPVHEGTRGLGHQVEDVDDEALVAVADEAEVEVPIASGPARAGAVHVAGDDGLEDVDEGGGGRGGGRVVEGAVAAEDCAADHVDGAGDVVGGPGDVWGALGGGG